MDMRECSEDSQNNCGNIEVRRGTESERVKRRLDPFPLSFIRIANLVPYPKSLFPGWWLVGKS